MKKLVGGAAAAVLLGLMAGPADAGPSAKAVYSYGDLNLVEEASIESMTFVSTETGESCDPEVVTDGTCVLDLEDLASSAYRIMQASIKAPRWKDLQVTVSLECGNFSETTVKSKGGAKDGATAESTVRILVLVDDGNGVYAAEPAGNPNRDLDMDGTADHSAGVEDGVIFCHHSQELEAKFQGIFQTGEASDAFFIGEDESVYATLEACEAAGNTMCEPITIVGTCLFQRENNAIVLDPECLEPEELRLTSAGMVAAS
ncbi:MAG: hypothetical protein ACYTFI_28770, partial [Planctomycetota bacterium]